MRTNSSGAEGQGFRIAEKEIPAPRQRIADSLVLRSSRRKRTVWLAILLVGILLVAGILRARGLGARRNSTSSVSEKSRAAAVLDIGVLVFREGLECILVLAAVTASLRGTESKYQRPVSVGAGIGFVATLLTWCVAVRIVDDIGKASPRWPFKRQRDCSRFSFCSWWELVLSQAVLDGVDFASQPAKARAAGA